jgi:hypothetical protein
MNIKVIEKDLLNPLAETDEVKINLNHIPDDFEYVSLLDNTKPGADVILRFVEENLGNKKYTWVQKPAGAPATIKQLESASKSEIVVLALGDCGSCSSWIILDAIRLEKMGTPTISICSDKFSTFAYELAKSHGAKDLNILSLEHPIAGLSNEEIIKKTFKILPSLRYILQIP